MEGFFAWLFDLPGWVQLGVATVWVYVVLFGIYWQFKCLDEFFASREERRKRDTNCRYGGEEG